MSHSDDGGVKLRVHPRGRACSSYADGHTVHFIHAKLAGREPWGWRDGTLVSVGKDGWLVVDYLTEPAPLVAWHHVDITGELPVGSPVRVHDRLHLLGSPIGWLNLYIRSGAGAVPTPTDTQRWQGLVVPGVTDLATGRAFALDHPTERDRLLGLDHD